MARGKKKESTLTPEEKLTQALVPVEEQPYKVPENWCWVRLDSVKLGVDGFFDGDWILSENMDPTGDIRLLQLSDIGIGAFLDKSNKHIDSAIFEELGCTELYAGDIMISRMAEPIARSCIVPSLPYKVITAVDVAVVRCNSAIIDNSFLNYLCNAKWFTDLALSKARGTTRVRITRQNLGEMPVPLPPLSEQQRIVDRIEYLFAKLDEAKEKARSVLDSFETRKAAILHKAFTGELTANWRAEHGVAMESIEKVPLGKLTDIVSSKRIYKDEYVETGVPFFRSSEVVELHDYGITTPGFFISRQRYEEIKKQYGVPHAGDLLVTSVGTIGKTWIVDGREFYYKDGNLTQVTQCESLDMRYLQFFIKSEFFKRQVNDTVAGSAYNALTIVKFKKILIPLFELAEQTEIVRILDSLFAKEQQAKEAAEAVLVKIELLKKSILARAFRGELGTNNPSEESAIELLKQIL